MPTFQGIDLGGETGIRTPDAGIRPHNTLAVCRFQPLSHLSSVYYI
jgi:hypothetical protein